MNGFNVKFGMRDNFLDGLMPLNKLLEHATINDTEAVIDARGLKHKELNDLIKETVQHDISRIIINNVFGQRYIGTRLFYPRKHKITIEINSFPGNDLGAFLDGHRIIVNGNAQDGVGNTMDSGEIIVHGRAGDVTAMSMRGGRIFIRDNVGYRAAIHMKEYRDRVPVLVIGGTAQDFLGEYMAGGIVILLGLTLQENELHRANHIGTGMHGGVIYLRGQVEQYQLGREVGVRQLDKDDKALIRKYVDEYCRFFNVNPEEILKGQFIKLLPVSQRPYGKIYAY